MTKPDDSSPAIGTPRNSQTPVIRKLVVAEEDGRTRLLNRQAPAWLISGMIHIVLIASFIVFDRWTKESQVKARTEPPTSTIIDDKAAKDADLTIPDVGLDEQLATFADPVKNDDANLPAPIVDNELSGLPNQEEASLVQPSILGTRSDSLTPGGSDPSLMSSPDVAGMSSGGGAVARPGLDGRSAAKRQGLLDKEGGTPETEAAVARALAWLAKRQNASGYWEFDGAAKGDRIAATGMCLLPFLAAGETHKFGKKYKDNVARGLIFLKAQLKPNGQFGNATMYSQAIATIALCEAAGMTRDEAMKNAARTAVDFIVKAQAGDGSWGYTANTEGDTSIVGWQIQALKSARLAGIIVPQKTIDQAKLFLESVEIANSTETTYGYRSKGGTNSLTAVGLLCRQYTGWTPRNPKLANGVEYMWTKFPPREENFDMYYYYYATQVVHFFGGPKWHANWNPLMRKLLLNKQITTSTPGAKAADIGSWPKENGHIGASCGKLATTAFCCLTLEVYYRYLPLYKRDAGVGALEK